MGRKSCSWLQRGVRLKEWESRRAEMLHRIIERFSRVKGNILLDLACGTGSLSFEMAALGYDVIGVDGSEEMLGIALEKKFHSGQPVQFICQDMRQLDMFGSVDITLCALDSLNHLPSSDDLRKVFESVALFSQPGGLFIFDMNTLYKHRNVLADNTFTYETDNVYCVWENSLDRKSDEVRIALEFFERREDGSYLRSSDRFSEWAYTDDEILRLLRETGFELEKRLDGDSFGDLRDDSQRTLYVTRCIHSGQEEL